MSVKNGEEESKYFSYFKKLYETWEKSASQAVEIWLKSPPFRNNMERALAKSVEFKNYINETMERNLKNKYIPMKSDMDKLSSSLKKLEQKLTSLEEKLKSIESSERTNLERKKTKSKARRKAKNEHRKV